MFRFAVNNKIMELNQLVYKGVIKERHYGENDFALFIGDSDEPIAEILQERINRKQVSIRYWISDTEKTKQELQESVLKNLFGAIDAEYRDSYSDLTGYLWTDENLMVGGHNLLEELRSNIRKFIYLEIDIHNTKK